MLTLRIDRYDEVEACWRDRLLFRYRARPDAPAFESPKPYFHPLCTPEGDCVTNWRPNDHPWHHGLCFTINRVNEENFWGGNSYRPGAGYRALDNVGGQFQAGWEITPRIEGSRCIRWCQRIEWRGPRGDLRLEESRDIAITLDDAANCLSIGWHGRLANRAGENLRLGSYASMDGLAGSHYNGLFIRLARELLEGGGHFLNSSGQTGEDAVHTTPSPWVAAVGRHDGSLRPTTLVLAGHPGNPGYAMAPFVRRYGPCLALPFDTAPGFDLAPAVSLSLRYRILAASGSWDADRIARWHETGWDR